MTANQPAAATRALPSVLVFWRHGRTEWNASGRLQGQSDIELDQTGLQQVQQAAKVLARTFPNAAILTSDLKRAKQTTEVLAHLTGQTPIVDYRLRERSFGDWEGLQRNEISHRWPEIFQAWQRGSDAVGKPPNGESRHEVGLRVAHTVGEYAAKLAGYQTMLVVSHGAAITAGITALIGEDPGAWHGITGLDNANWSVLVKKPPSQNWRLVGHNLGVTPLNVGEVFGA